MAARHTMPPVDNFLETMLGVFIDSRRVRDKGVCSFTGMGQIKGKFMVKDEEYPQFFDLLHEYLFTQQRRPLNLVEQRRCDGYSPILIDLDFKYPAERAIQRQFDMSHIHQFVQNYIENITHFYDLSEFDKPLRFFISLRPAPYEDKKNNATNRSIKDGVHIQCPDLILHSEHQQVLRNKSLELNNLAEAFKNTGYINTEKDIFDEAVANKNGWFFYGESKPDIPAYALKSVYVYNPIDGEFYEDDIEDYDTRRLLEILSIRHNLFVKTIPIHEEVQDEWKERLDYCTGKRIPQVRFITENKENKENHGEDDELNDDIGDTTHITTTSHNHYEQMELDKINLAKKLAIECLSADRASGYQTWIEVGWCLHNIDPSEDMFNTWLEFSAKSPKVGENNINALLRDWNRGWSRSTYERQFTIRSLHMWARIDNPKRYKQLMENSFIDFVEREVDATHTHIARLMKKMYGNNYCAAIDSKKTDWFEFNGICWEKLAQGIDLRNKMTTEVAGIISKTREGIRERLLGMTNDERAFEETRLKKMTKIENCLYTSGFKDSVMKECSGLFYEKDFALKLNANQYLIGFNNGVLDLHAVREKEDGGKEYYVNFRKAEPSDFITFMAGRYSTKNCDPIDYIKYDPQNDEHTKYYNEIEDFMTKVFPRPELRAYMWRKLASCLEGTNKEQTFETWIGVGGNGKSKLVDLMSMTLGDYSSSLQSTAMTRKRPDAGSANPDIAAIQNKRFIYMSEPDDREPLNTSRMKQFTGEDDVEFRHLYGEQLKMKITGKMFMLCNAFPTINTQDTGTWRRMRVVPFESRFVPKDSDELKNNEKNVHPRDPQLDNKIRKWRTYFMAKLVHIYETEYLKCGIGKEPEIVMQESNKYKEKFDSVAKFLAARTREGSDKAQIKDIYRVYKNWFESVGGGMGRKLSQEELYSRLRDKLGEPEDKRTFKRIILFEDDDQIEEYDRGLTEAN
jgi:P4 family phage/plasmid primase-like protien